MKDRIYVENFMLGEGKIRRDLIGACGARPKEVGNVWINEGGKTRMLYLGNPAKGDYFSVEDIKKAREDILNGKYVEFKIEVSELEEWGGSSFFGVKGKEIEFINSHDGF